MVEKAMGAKGSKFTAERHGDILGQRRVAQWVRGPRRGEGMAAGTA